MNIGFHIVQQEVAEKAVAAHRARQAVREQRPALSRASNGTRTLTREEAVARIALKSPRAALRLLADYLRGIPRAKGQVMMQTEDRTNLAAFEALFLGLGSDVIKLDGSRYDAELLQAKASAAGRWLRLQQLKAQVEREAAILAARPKERGYPGDEFIADSLVARQAEAWKVQTDEMASSLEYIREQAKQERKELESFITKRR
jgi:hypothetical protein